MRRLLLLGLLFGWMGITTIFAQESNFYLHENGVTVMCTDAEVGETGTVYGVTYTKRTGDQITSENASTTCTSGITNMSRMFLGEFSFNGDIRSWDVSSVINMSMMFELASSFNADISYWNVSNVTDMSWMFNGAPNFNSDLNTWDVSNVTNMRGMFNAARSLIGDLSDWDVSNVINMRGMFQGAESFNGDLSSWNVSKVTDMNNMFRDASSFNQNLSLWCVSDISSEPNNFSSGSQLTPENHPQWGTCPGEPDPILLISPENGEEDVSVTPSFNWKVDTLATSYQLQVFEGTDPVVIDTIISSVPFITPFELSDDTVHNWRVRGINDNLNYIGDWSSIWSFTTLIIPVEIITLSSPVNGASNVDISPTLLWYEDPYADTYTVQVSTDSFETFIVNESLSESSYTISALNYNTEYMWRVRGTNDGGDGEWSEAWVFTTQEDLLDTPELVSPINGNDNIGTLTEFSWSEVDDAISYHIQVSLDDEFTAIHFESSEIEFNSFTLSDPLEVYTAYYWRVRSLSESEEKHSGWSEVWMFSTGSSTSISNIELPAELALRQNYPNPFNPTTIITFGLPESSSVQLAVYDMLGRRVAVLEDGMRNAGWHQVNFDASSFSSGIYIYRITAGDFVKTKKMMLVK